MAQELFELEMLGDAVERRYRKARPEIDAMPWGTLDLTGVPEQTVIVARRSWTSAAFQEHRTAVACSLTLRALLECRAPLDLVGTFARFPLDEVAHVELCARLAGELGGGTEIIHDPENMVYTGDPSHRPLLRAADLVVRNFCVGEALSIPMLHGTWKWTSHPLPKAVLGRIVRDEAAHGIVGFTFLDWALPQLTAEEQAVVGRAAQQSIDSVFDLWADIRRSPRAPPTHARLLGWMETGPYLKLAEWALRTRVVEPLRARGLDVSAVPAHVTEARPDVGSST
jgi:hypothetical protein